MVCDRFESALIVDDNPEIVNLFATWLEDDYEVRTAYSGEEAIEKLDASVDVVLLDRELPTMTGDDVLERVLTRELGCPVVMVTSTAPDLDIIELECDRYLVKPVSKDELVDTLARLCQLSTYDETIQEYYALLQKRIAIEQEFGGAELAGSPRYRALCDQIESLEATLDRLTTGFEGIDFAMMLMLIL